MTAMGDPYFLKLSGEYGMYREPDHDTMQHIECSLVHRPDGFGSLIRDKTLVEGVQIYAVWDNIIFGATRNGYFAFKVAPVPTGLPPESWLFEDRDAWLRKLKDLVLQRYEV